MENVNKIEEKKPTVSSVNNKNNFDVSEIMWILQFLGFAVNTYEVENSLETELLNAMDSGCLKVDIKCNKSGVSAKLTKNLIDCKCPNKTDANKIKYWNVCESERDNIVTSGSSIIPCITPANHKEIAEHLEKAFYLMNKSNPKIQNINDNIIITPVKSAEDYLRETKQIKEQGLEKVVQTWEVDPNTSPPKLTSSPLSDLTSSVKLNSINVENSNNLLDLFLGIQKLVEEGKELIASKKNKTFTKLAPLKKRVSNIKISPLALQNTPISGEFIKMNCTRSNDRLLRTTPRKIIEPLKSAATTGDKRKVMNPPSRIGMLYKRTLGNDNELTPTNSKKIAVRHDTPIPKVKLNSNGLIATTLSPLCRFKYARSGSAVTPSGENMPAGVSRLKIPSKSVTPNKKK